MRILAEARYRPHVSIDRLTLLTAVSALQRLDAPPTVADLAPALREPQQAVKAAIDELTAEDHLEVALDGAGTERVTLTDRGAARLARRP